MSALRSGDAVFAELAALLQDASYAELERFSRVVRHPLRLRVLAYLLEHDSVCASEFARRYDVDLSALSYHVRTLERLGLLTVVRRDCARGGVRTWHSLSPELRAGVAAPGRSDATTASLCAARKEERAQQGGRAHGHSST